MGIKVKNPTTAQIEELRQRFNAKYASSPPAAPFHPVDIDRIRNDQVWLRRFLEMFDLDMDTAFDKLWETCVWRQSYGANDLNEKQLKQEYLEQGGIFIHGQDVDGNPLLIFRVKFHNKSFDLNEIIRIVVYWVERTQREIHMTQLTIMFDMAGTGLSSLDMDFVKRIVDTFKLYYPNALNYILVFELAWVLNAAFKVIKSLLPPKAVEILKMISKKDITQYIPKDNCMTSWGGTDNYEYRFVPEAKLAKAKPLAANAGDDDQPHQDMTLDKKVHFAERTPMVLHDSSIGELHTPSEGEGMLQLEPSDFINFNPQSGEAKLSLRNVSKVPVAYKIQTTTPDKFRVRPRCGVVQPNDSAEVNIILKADCNLSSDSKDKFLIMATQSPGEDCASPDVAELWRQKSTNDPDVENHRLVCRLAAKCKDGVSKNNSQALSREFGTQQLQEQAKEMAAQLNFTRNLQYATLALMVLLFAAIGFMIYGQMSHTSGSCQKTTAYQCPRRK